MLFDFPHRPSPLRLLHFHLLTVFFPFFVAFFFVNLAVELKISYLLDNEMELFRLLVVVFKLISACAIKISLFYFFTESWRENN